MTSPGLYVHVPFCRSKCPYCGFYSIPSRAPVGQWLEGLEREILLTKGQFDSYDTLYLGGGTPSFLDRSSLKRVLSLLRTHYPLTQNAEITLEANPCDVNLDKAHFFKSLGVNRINLGVQSFEDRVLRFLGRGHSSEDAENAISYLRSAGFWNIGLDLIYGFGAQPMKEWIATLKKGLSFEPEHLSCYQLTMEKGTVFGRNPEKKARIALPEKIAAAHFLATAAFLENNGYIHYEVSNFARGKAFESRHNRKYWQHIPYLGLGPSAHSFDGKKRWWQVRSVRKYCHALDRGRLPVLGSETLTQKQHHLEYLALGLRTRNGVLLEKLPSVSRKALFMLQKEGFLKMKNGKAVPTRRGYLMADHLPLWLSPS